MQAAKIKNMKVTSDNADKYVNLNFSIYFLFLLFYLCGLFLCGLEAQSQQLLTWQHDGLEAMNRTAINDKGLARLIRAAHSTRLKRFEISGTNIGAFLNTFEQVARLLEAARRFPRQLITFFGLSSTGLGECHFRRIITAVQNMQRLPAPWGRPDENDMCSEMELHTN